MSHHTDDCPLCGCQLTRSGEGLICSNCGYSKRRRAGHKIGLLGLVLALVAGTAGCGGQVGDSTPIDPCTALDDAKADLAAKGCDMGPYREILTPIDSVNRTCGVIVAKLDECMADATCRADLGTMGRCTL
jgi:hypothetical protein